MVWINNGDSGLSVRTKLNTIPNDGTNCTALFTGGALGTPSSGTLTNCTGLPAAGVVGTALVVGGALGTPASGTLTNCSGLPATGVVGTAATLGTNTFTGAQIISSASFTTSGNISAPTWGGAAVSNITGVLFTSVPATFTDTTAATGTTAVSATSIFGGNAIAATNTGVIYTNYYAAYFKAEAAGSHVTLTNSWGLGADSASLGASNPLTISSTGVVKINSFASFLVNGATQIGTSITNIANTQVGIFWNSPISDSINFRTNANAFYFSLAPSATPAANTITIGALSRAGTDSNVGGGNGSVQPGLGTGTGTLSKFIINSPVAAVSGNTAQTYSPSITVNSSASGGIQFNGYTSAGAVSTDSSGNLTTVSSLALKTDIRRFEYGLDILSKIDPKWWKWKESTGWDTHSEYAGFISDEVEALIPELSGLGDHTRAVVAACVNAIKILSYRCEKLENMP